MLFSRLFLQKPSNTIYPFRIGLSRYFFKFYNQFIPNGLNIPLELLA